MALWPSALKASPRQRFGTSFVAVNKPVSHLGGIGSFFRRVLQMFLILSFFPELFVFISRVQCCGSFVFVKSSRRSRQGWRS